MRKSIVLAAVAAFAGIGMIWSAVHTGYSKSEATKTSAPISPHDEMVKRGSSLPVEYWAHPF